MNTPCPLIERKTSFDCCVILGILNLPVKNTACAAEVTSIGIVRMTREWQEDEIRDIPVIFHNPELLYPRSTLTWPDLSGLMSTLDELHRGFSTDRRMSFNA
jgi:hypothetical protein